MATYVVARRLGQVAGQASRGTALSAAIAAGHPVARNARGNRLRRRQARPRLAPGRGPRCVLPARDPSPGAITMPSANPPPQILSVFSTFAVGGPQVRFTKLAAHFGERFRHAVVAMDHDYGCRARLD